MASVFHKFAISDSRPNPLKLKILDPLPSQPVGQPNPWTTVDRTETVLSNCQLDARSTQAVLTRVLGERLENDCDALMDAFTATQHLIDDVVQRIASGLRRIITNHCTSVTERYS